VPFLAINWEKILRESTDIKKDISISSTKMNMRMMMKVMGLLLTPFRYIVDHTEIMLLQKVLGQITLTSLKTLANSTIIL
jgi:hypothetical protein